MRRLIRIPCAVRALSSDTSVAGTAEISAKEVISHGKIWTTVPRDVSYSHHPVEDVWQSQDHQIIELHSKDLLPVGYEGLGVLREDKDEDLRALVEGFTSPALAAALRDRESTLQMCAHLIEKGDLEQTRRLLKPYTLEQVYKQRDAMLKINVEDGFSKDDLSVLKKFLNRMPRHVAKSTEHRASVMIPLCNVERKPSILFTKRSDWMRTHKNEVCFPGGKVDQEIDKNIYNTAVREMIEEIGLQTPHLSVLGVLRCDWSEVASFVGVAVTPVVGFIGDLTREQLKPNPNEVSHCFTVPIKRLLDNQFWIIEDYKAPVFTGGPYVIWGLTGYILHRFVKDVLDKHISFT